MKQDEKNEKKLKFQHWQVIALLLGVFDIFAVNFSYFAALLIRFNFHYSEIPLTYLGMWKSFAPYYTIICILVFYFLRLYHSLWRFASYTELLRSIIAAIITTAVQIGGTLLTVGRMPVSYYIGGAACQFFLVLAIRFSYRFILLLRGSRVNYESENLDNVMLIGAGNAGQMILRDFHRAKEIKDRVVCIIDDNPNKWGRYIDGVPVVGGRDDILVDNFIVIG